MLPGTRRSCIYHAHGRLVDKLSPLHSTVFYAVESRVLSPSVVGWCLSGPAFECPGEGAHLGEAEQIGNLRETLDAVADIAVRQLLAYAVQLGLEGRVLILQPSLQGSDIHVERSGHDIVTDVSIRQVFDNCRSDSLLNIAIVQLSQVVDHELVVQRRQQWIRAMQGFVC